MSRRTAISTSVALGVPLAACPPVHSWGSGLSTARTRRTPHPFSVAACLAVCCSLASLPARAAVTVYPIADGTLADGGGLGPYDHVADGWNWAFAPTGFAGAVSLTTETPASSVEHRIVCEYDLRPVALAVPIEATLTFTVRGIRAAPFPDVNLHVYSYPADLLEKPADFSAGPPTLRGVVTVAAMQPARVQTLDVTELVSSALRSSDKRLAFRFQIDPHTPHVANQVFIDALDAVPSTKPFLTIRSAVPGDADDDGDADLDDFAVLMSCLAGPEGSSTPTTPGITAADCLRTFDRDDDGDVDLGDLSSLLPLFAR